MIALRQILQKHEHHDGHQHDRVAQPLEHFVDRLVDKRRGVVDDRVVDPLRKAALEIFHLLPHLPRHLERVGAGQLVDRQRHGRLPVEPAGLIVALGAQLDAGHVLQPHESTGRLALEDHLGELFRIGQAAHRADGELEDLPAIDRRLADLPGGHLRVLLLDGGHDVAGRQIARGHPLRVEPEPHAVVALAEIGDVAHALQARQLVFELDRGVVAQVQVVAQAAGREQIDDHQHAGRFLLHRHAPPLHQLGQDRLGQRHAVLHEHLGHVQVDVIVKRDGQRVAAVVAALRRHVQHVFHAVDLLFDRRGHGVGHHLGVCARVRGRDFDRGRRDLRVLRDGQRKQRDPAGQRDDDRQHRGKDRPVDEKPGKHRYLIRAIRDPTFHPLATPSAGPASSADARDRSPTTAAARSTTAASGRRSSG